MDKPLSFLGGLTARQFLDEYWQKKALFVPGAFAALMKGKGFVSPARLLKLAAREDAESRLVTLDKKGVWSLENGPFPPSRWTRQKKRKTSKWTVLVQGVNFFVPEGERLLAEFNFVPHARLDDLMVSYAPAGGSVGPHIDSYDVFLIQGLGHRRWQVSTQADRALVEGAPLRILQRFEPTEEWVTSAGDLLYLPPQYAHYGLALDECMTYSVGFRVPSGNELKSRFLDFLDDEIDVPGLYEDPDLTPSAHPSEVGDDMVSRVERMFDRIQWTREDVARFVGRYMSEPKPFISFEPPSRPLSLAAFSRRVAQSGVRLAPTTLLLSRGATFFINGECHESARPERPHLLRLADTRSLPPSPRYPPTLLSTLHSWHQSGFLQ